jgi:pantoate--beta-alanine ligase
MRSIIEGEPLARIDYIAVTDTNRLDALDAVAPDRPALVSMAVFIGTTRLIDNIVLNGEL